MGEHIAKWDSLGVPRDEFWELVKGLPCNVGIDLSKSIDLTADSFIFILDDGRIAISAHGFIPEQAVERHEKTDKIPYRDWAEAGWLTVTEGGVTDDRRISDHIAQLESGLYSGLEQINPELFENLEELAAYKAEHGVTVNEICYDPYQALSFKNRMEDDGYECAEVRQIMPTLSQPTKLFRELVISDKLVHDGSPLLKWCVGNAVQIVNTKEDIMISKKNASDTRRVDLLAATISALQRIEPLRTATPLKDWIESEDFGF